MSQLFISVSSTPTNFGARVYKALFERYAIDALYVPRLAPKSAKDLVRAIRTLNIAGCSVSMPLKAQVLAEIDSLDALANSVFAVNTIANRDGVLRGYNTDIAGLIGVLAQYKLPRVVIYGCGAMLPVLKYVLVNYCDSKYIAISARRSEIAKEQANRYNINFQENFIPIETAYDLLINATPASLSNTEPQLLHLLDHSKACFDLALFKSETWLVANARQQGKQTHTGVDMYIGHICKQFEIYCNITPELKQIESEVDRILKCA